MRYCQILRSGYKLVWIGRAAQQLAESGKPVKQREGLRPSHWASTVVVNNDRLTPR
jgi:hypothetical protein